MCQRMPGSRCSPHTRDAHQHAQKVLLDLKNSLPRGVRLPAAESERLEKAEMQYRRARRDYYASPEGLSTLNALIDEAIANKQSRKKISELAFLRDIAIKDSAEHALAGKIYSRSRGVNGTIPLNKPEEYGPLQDAGLKVQEAREHLAECIKNKVSDMSLRIAHQQNVDAQRRYTLNTQHFLIQGSGIEYQPGLRIATATALAADNAFTAYLHIPHQDFKKVGSYFPLGGYAQITQHEIDKYGNNKLTLENGETRIVSAKQPVLITPRSE